MTATHWIVWCNDGTGSPFNIAVCKSEAEALSTRGMAAALDPEKTFTIAKEHKN